MGTLEAIEEEGLGVLADLLLGGVGCGILDAAGLAKFGGTAGVEGIEEEGRCGGGQDEAGLALEREVRVRDLEVRGQRDKDVRVSAGEANIDRHCGRDAGASEL